MPSSEACTNRLFFGSSEASEVRFQTCPFQCATCLPPTAQTSFPARPLPAVRPCPDGGAVQVCPFQCRAPSGLPPKKSWPNAHTSCGPSTAAPASGRPKVPRTVQAWPFQRSARDPPLPKFRLENAQTLLADEEAAAMTCSLARPGNAALCQPPPVSCQAAERVRVPGSKASKAQAAAGPVAV